MEQRRRAVVIGTVLVAALAACKESAPPPLRLEAGGRWGGACDAPYTVRVNSAPGASVEVLGQQVTVGASGTASLELARAAVGEAKMVVVTAQHGARRAERNVAVGRNPTPAVMLSDLQYRRPDAGTFTGRLVVGDGAPSELEVRSRHDGDGPTADQVIVELRSCGVGPPLADPGITSVVADDHVTITIDLGERLLYGAVDGKAATVDVPVRFTTSTGAPAVVTFTIQRPAAHVRLGAVARFADVRNHPVPEAPAVASVPAPRPLAIVKDGQLDGALLDGQAPIAAPLVAVVTYEAKRIGTCGPYSAGRVRVSADRYRHDLVAAIFETRTGAQVASKTFAGSKPSCPSSISSYGGAPETVDGDRATAALLAWLDQARR